MNKICVSIGTDNMNSLRNLVSDSLDNADYVEVRFDYFGKDSIDGALETVLEKKERTVFTCRSASEGGKYTGAETERIAILRRLASFRPMFLDIEYNTLTANEYLIKQFGALNCNMLVSWHDFTQTPDTEELDVLLSKMKVYSDNVKIVTIAKNIDDNFKVLKLYENARRMNVHLIAFCMGEYGVLSRVLCVYAGAPFTYATLKDAVAPGQLTVKQMKTIFDRLKDMPELEHVWKDRREFDDILRIINETKA
jgi:3-dehydroquinate dehydratase-1